MCTTKTLHTFKEILLLFKYMYYTGTTEGSRGEGGGGGGTSVLTQIKMRGNVLCMKYFLYMCNFLIPGLLNKYESFKYN